MSILLDALKKSEEQRQLGQTPTIHSPSGEPVRGGDGGTQWVPLAMMTLAALAMAWIGWQQFRPLPETGTAPTTDVVANEPAADVPQPEGQAASEPADETGSAATELPAEPVTARRPQVVAGAGQRTPVESFKPDTRALRDATVMPPADAERGEAPAARAMAQTGTTVEPEADAAAGPARGDPESVTEQPRTGRTPQHQSQPISYWELPQNVRDDMPDLHISVLVYAERPEDRFVLINGQRVVEREVVDHGVVLEEIRRNGAVFQYRTYRFMVEG